MELYEAILKRKSTRKYSSDKLSTEMLDHISKRIDEAHRLYQDIDMQVHLVEEGDKIFDIMAGVVGSFGKVKAPHFLVVTSEMKDGYLENVGYTLEQIVLNLTAMGLASCWLGGHVRDEQVRGVVGMPEHHTTVVMVSFGLPQDTGNLYRLNPGEAKRKQVADLIAGDFDQSWDNIMEAIKIAPSAGNTQPWRFIKDKELIHVFCAKPSNFLTKRLFARINRVDVGIALCHLSIATGHYGKNIRLERQQVEDNLQGTYITTAIELS